MKPRRRTELGRYAPDLELRPPPERMDFEKARRLLGLRSVWKRLAEAGHALELSLEGDGGEYVPIGERRRALMLRAEVDELRTDVNALAPGDDAMRAYVSETYWNASPEDRALFDKLRNQGRIRPGIGGGRSHERYKNRDKT